jgi:hypothetical protein
MAKKVSKKDIEEDMSIVDDYWNLHWTQSELKQEALDIKKYEDKLRKAILKAQKKNRKRTLKSVARGDSIEAFRRENFTTSKLFMFIIIINCSIIEIYSMFIMYKMKNLDALTTLIGAVVGESVSFAIYCAKSYFGKKEEVRSDFEREKYNAENDGILDQYANGSNDDSSDDSSCNNTDTTADADEANTADGSADESAGTESNG